MRVPVFSAAVLGVTLSFSLAGTACAKPAQVAATTDQQDSHAKDRAASLFNQFASGKLDRSDFTPEMDKAMTPELLKQVQPQFATLGSLTALTLTSKQDVPERNGTKYTYAATFTGGDHKVILFLTKDGKVGGYRVVP